MKKVMVLCLIMQLSIGFLFANGVSENESVSAIPQQKEDAAGLYESAKEEGKVVVYSVSSRIKNSATTFMEEYPGITVEAYDMRMPAILEKLEREIEAGVKNADVILGNDNGGSLTFESLPAGVISTWVPFDMNDRIDSFKDSSLYDFTVELVCVFFNNEVYQQAPVSSWWDLTRPQWKGKIMMPDPMSAPEILSLFGSFSQHSEEMAADYEKCFGEKLVLNNTPDAGYEFMKRLLANDVVIVDSQGGAIKAIGAPGQSDPSLAIVVSSKLRDRVKNLNIAIATDLTPVAGMANPNSLILVADAPHPNAAKLFIRWVAGEADGTGKGFDSFKVIGAWPARKCGTSVSDQSLSDLEYWIDDHEFMYYNGLKLRDAWLIYQE